MLHHLVCKHCNLSNICNDLDICSHLFLDAGKVAKQHQYGSIVQRSYSDDDDDYEESSQEMSLAIQYPESPAGMSIA